MSTSLRTATGVGLALNTRLPRVAFRSRRGPETARVAVAMAQIKSRRPWTIPYSLQICRAIVLPPGCLGLPGPCRVRGGGSDGSPRSPVQGKQFWLSPVKVECRNGGGGRRNGADGASYGYPRPVPLVLACLRNRSRLARCPADTGAPEHEIPGRKRGALRLHSGKGSRVARNFACCAATDHRTSSGLHTHWYCRDMAVTRLRQAAGNT